MLFRAACAPRLLSAVNGAKKPMKKVNCSAFLYSILYKLTLKSAKTIYCSDLIMDDLTSLQEKKMTSGGARKLNMSWVT